MSGEPESERLGCCCVLFISEDDGTRPGTRVACVEHRRIAKENFLGE